MAKWPVNVLFPTTIQLSGSDHAVLQQLLPGFQALGFDIESFGGNAFIVSLHVCLLDWNESSLNPVVCMRTFLRSYLKRQIKKHIIARPWQSISPDTSPFNQANLDNEKMQYLIDQLFSCEDHAWSPLSGRCYTNIGLDEIVKRLK